MIKKIIASIFLILIFTLNASAEELSSEELYREQYDKSRAEEIEGYLPEDTRDFLKENDIDPSGVNLSESLKLENVFTHIFDFLKSGAKAPIASGSIIFSVILINALISGLDLKGASGQTAIYASALTAVAAVATPVFSAINCGVNALSGCAAFVAAFVPIFAVIVASSGAAATSVSMSSLLLGACQIVNFICNFVVMPLMGGFLAVSTASAVSPILGKSGIADGIKKICFWTMSLLTTVFVGILSIQTAVNAAADTLSVKATKFIIGSAVPVAGTALSEALTTVTASMGILKTSVGVYGVIACAVIFLPILAELIMWRISLNINSAVSDLFSLPHISAVLRSVDTVISLLIGIILLTEAMFIISLGVVISAGGGK